MLHKADEGAEKIPQRDDGIDHADTATAVGITSVVNPGPRNA